MGETAFIRRAVEADYEAVKELAEASFRFHQQSRPDCFTADLSDSYPLHEFQELLGLPCPIAWVAELEGRMAGICFGEVGPAKTGPIFLPRRVARIDDLFTLPEYRGRGIATALIARTREQGVSEGAQTLELCVWGFNEGARRLYEHMGMTVQYVRMEQPI